MPAQLMPHSEHKTHWVVVSQDEYESMQRTIEVLSDKDLVRQIVQSEADIKAGRVSKWKDFVKEMKKN